jgi:hypothetical protein
MAEEAGLGLTNARYDSAERSRVGASIHRQHYGPQIIGDMLAGS